MIQATRSPLIKSPYAPPRAARVTTASPPAPLDVVSVSAPSAPRRSWKAVGLAVLLAAPLVGGALSTAEAHEWTFPASTSTVCALPPDVSAAPPGGAQDNTRMQRDIFDANVASLQRQGSFVEQLAKRGSFKDGSCTVTVSAGHIEMSDSDHGAVVDTHSGERTVTIRQGDFEQTLKETPRERTVTSGAVSRSLYLQDVDGHIAGDFSMLISGAAK